MSLPKPLMFTVGLIDQITKPIAKISQQFNGLASNYQAGTMQMASGIGGIAAAGYALQSALMPAIEMDRVLGEVKSLGVRESALKQLTDTSYDYAMKYGKSATEFVSSSYDIQSAIAGLNDADLSAFTLSSNVLAAATKADAATITNYMGTMYGIFKNQANDMGKSEWVAQVTGMTATAVQAFKTTGSEMSGAFTAIGAEATSAGIAMSEQMAILGTLQSTMSGSESGTKYKAFLAGVGKAQKALGLEFTDSQGRLLPMIDILTKIKGKYGETLEVAESDALAKAFGSSEAVSTVKLLMGDINGLGESINTLGKVKGMGKAEEMAAAMTDQSERLVQSWYVIRAAFGSAVLPAFNSFVGWIADMGREVVAFTNTYQELTKRLGYAGIAILSLVAAGGAFTVMVGAAKMAAVAWNVTAMVTSGIYKIMTIDLGRLQRQLTLMPYLLQRWSRTSKLAAAAQWALNLAMTANPIGVVVAGVMALIGAVIAAVYYFDDLKKMLAGTAWGEPIIWAGQAIAKMFKDIGTAMSMQFGMFVTWGKLIWTALEPLASALWGIQLFFLKIGGSAVFAVFSALAFLIGGLATGISHIANGIGWVATYITGVFSVAIDAVSGMWEGIMSMFDENMNWIIDKLNLIPGVDISTNVSSNSIPSVAAIAPVQTRVDRGGITQNLSTANQQKSTSVGTVNVYPAKGDDNFMNYVEMHG